MSTSTPDINIVPERAFLFHRYTILALSVVIGIGAMVWVHPLSPLGFWIWVRFIAVSGATTAAWFPYHTRTLRYVLQADRLAAYQGVWFRTRRFIPYARITDVTIAQGPIERGLGISRLIVQTAGSSAAEAILLGVGDPNRIRALLLERKASAAGVDLAKETPVDLLRGIRHDLAEIRELLRTTRRT